MEKKICSNQERDFCFDRPRQKGVRYLIKVSKGEITSFNLIVGNQAMHHCLHEGDYFWQRIKVVLKYCYQSDRGIFKSIYNMLSENSNAKLIAKEVLISIVDELKEKIKNTNIEIDEISLLIC